MRYTFAIVPDPDVSVATTTWYSFADAHAAVLLRQIGLRNLLSQLSLVVCTKDGDLWGGRVATNQIKE